jgi:hypothetical protein
VPPPSLLLPQRQLEVLMPVMGQHMQTSGQHYRQQRHLQQQQS